MQERRGMTSPVGQTVRLGDFTATSGGDVTYEPDAKQRHEIAAALGVEKVRKLVLTGKLIPEHKKDWRLEAKLGATVIQSCVRSLAPVTTRIDETLTRRYLSDLPHLPTGEEIEMPEDDTVEPLPDAIDLAQIATEALALALPAYPLAENAELDPAYADDLANDHENEKPFSGLASLRDKLRGNGD